MIERVVVTGASGGVGTACVATFQDLGTEVIGVDVVESSPADQHLQIDSADPHCGDQLISLLGDRAVDGLINNAGVQLNMAAEETSAAAFDHVYRVNLRAPLLFAGALKDKLAERSGFVVNVSSVHAVATSRLVSAYAATKGGLVALTRALAVEWAPDIRVNAVLPGAIHTPMLMDGLSRSKNTLETLGKKHPLGRIGEPEEVADAIVFLANNQFATGSILTIDGGATSRLSTE